MTDRGLQMLMKAAKDIEEAEAVIVAASNDTWDIDELTRLEEAHLQLDGLLTALIKAQEISDDADFAVAAVNLKLLAAELQSDEAGIKKIVGNIATAAQIVGYAIQAAELVAKAL
jgi:hypothetical protein